MEITKKYTGKLPTILHAPADFALAGTPAVILAACRAENGQVPDSLDLVLGSGETFTMSPADSYESAKSAVSYEIYRADVPASAVTGKTLEYTICPKGAIDRPAGTYRVKLVDPAKIPPMPPVAVTELYQRPKAAANIAYVEVTNPSSAPVDLYDYELLVYPNSTAPSEKYAGRLPMSDVPGKNILAPGEFAAIWHLKLKNFDVEIGGVKQDIVTPEDFCRIFNSDFFYTGYGLTPDACRIIPVNCTVVDEDTGKRIMTSDFVDLPEKHSPTTLVIVPRGKDASDGVFSMVYSYSYTRWDTPVKRSSYWTLDPMDTTKGKNICHAALATPGYAVPGQCVPDASAVLPAIIPLAPDTEAWIGEGDVTVSFALIPGDPCREPSATVRVAGEDGDVDFPAVIDQTDGVFRAVIPYTFVEKLKKLEYSVIASDGTRYATLFGDEIFSVPVRDNAGPRITASCPTKAYAYDGTLENTPVYAEYYDVSGVKRTACRMYVDGKDVSDDAVWTDSRVDYVPGKPFSVGEHQLVLELVDTLGNKNVRKIDFTVSDMKELFAYRGEVHAHTSESDGTGMAADAFEYARDVGRADYFAVTEHSHYLAPELYEVQTRVADSFDEPGKFAAIYGWEMTYNNTCGYWGHLNVLNSREIVNFIKEVDMPGLFKWAEGHPEAIGMFNHPGYNWGNFDEYDHYTPEADKFMCLAEIKGAGYDREYAHMLSRGWHCSPVSNEDNHAPNWTTATTLTGFVLAPALTRLNVLDAFRARRTYTTSDPTMKVFFRINGRWMGSRVNEADLLAAAPDGKLHFDISVTTEDDNGIGTVEIIGEDNVTLASRNVGLKKSFTWKPVLASRSDYYYIRITNGKGYTATAPLWVEQRTAPVVSEIRYNASQNSSLPAAVTAVVTNPTGEKMTDLRVSYVLSTVAGFKADEAEPYSVACLGKLKPGQSAECTRELPEKMSYNRVTVTATALCGGKRVTGTAYILISPVTITEVTPDTDSYTDAAGNVYENPFPYLTLYNSSPVEVSLKGGRLALWTSTGKAPLPDHIWLTDGVKIPPRSSVVIWNRKKSCAALTVAEFNERYGTTFTEGEDLFVADIAILGASPDGRRLDLAVDGKIMSRVHWNYGLEYDAKSHKGAAHKYAYRPNMTLTSTPIGMDLPVPAHVNREQRREQSEITVPAKQIKQEVKSAKKDKKTAAHAAAQKVTPAETAAIAAGAAAVVGGAAAAIAALFRKKR